MRRIFIIIALLALLTGALSAAAQEESGPRVAIGDFSFTLDPALATNINRIQFPGDPVDEMYPGGAQPPHTRILLYDELPAPEVMLMSRATIFLYSLAAVERYADAQAQVDALRALLADRPDLTTYEAATDNLSDLALPFLPIVPAGQVIRARTQYVETDAVEGISFVTIYRQDASPFLDYEFIYTFQGFSADGMTYVSVVMPVYASMFDSDLPTDFDYETFVAGMNTYFAESVDRLNAGTEADFAPALPLGAALVESLAFDGRG